MTCVDKATPGRCIWRMRADERFANPAGIMQGGFLAAFADSAMGAAAVTFVDGPPGLRLQRGAEDQLLGRRPARQPTSRCTAEVVSGGRRVAFVEASILAREPGSGHERLVARASSTYLFKDRD